MQSKRVKLQSCRRPPVFQGDPALCWKKEDALPWVLTIDLTFHGQWDTSKVRRQPPCSGSFACLKKPSWSCHPHWCHRQNLQQQTANHVLPSPSCRLAHLSTDLYSKGGCARITTLGKPPLSEYVLKRDFAV